MKWFKHQTDASDDIKIKRLEDKFEVGYKIFFKIVEKVGKEGKNYELDIKKYPIEFLARDFRVDAVVLQECLTFMDELGLIVHKYNKISVPNMKKYADEYTQKKSGQYPDELPTKSDNRLDKNRLDKTRTDADVNFLEFYKLYPKKVNRKGAELKWNKVKPEEHEKIFIALEVYKQSEQWLKDAGKFIPYPATWLNQERWKDEPPRAAEKQPFYKQQPMKKVNGFWKVFERGQWLDYGGKLSEIIYQ